MARMLQVAALQLLFEREPVKALELEEFSINIQVLRLSDEQVCYVAPLFAALFYFDMLPMGRERVNAPNTSLGQGSR